MSILIQHANTLVTMDAQRREITDALVNRHNELSNTLLQKAHAA
ncbi:MAG: hypothetical protein O6938_01135 [Gammaproteobacteria bacterium]|nr:hypothetical protein [Gammaproteobacteria bacterium]